MAGYIIHKDHKYIKKERRPYGWRYWYKLGESTAKKFDTKEEQDNYRDDVARRIYDTEMKNAHKAHQKEYLYESIAGQYSRKLYDSSRSDTRNPEAYATNRGKRWYFQDLAKGQSESGSRHYANALSGSSNTNDLAYTLGSISGNIQKAGHDFLEKFKKK